MLPSLARILAELGANIRLARLRRRLSAVQVAERAGITRQTLHAIERGAPSVGMGNYAMVLFVLGLEKDLLRVGADDVLGRKLQDIGLETPKRAPRRRKMPTA
jgi:transcriptional regulator with XRE-family HTH domain